MIISAQVDGFSIGLKAERRIEEGNLDACFVFDALLQPWNTGGTACEIDSSDRLPRLCSHVEVHRLVHFGRDVAYEVVE